MEFIYNWEKHPEVKEFINKIYNNSQKNNQSLTIDTKIKLVINYLEEYFHLLLTFNCNLSKFIDSLNNIDKIEIINMDIPIYTLGSKLGISNNLFKEENINESIYYLYYELSKHIFNFKSDTTYNFSQIYSNYLEDSSDKIRIPIMVNYGWEFISEILSQDLAERLLYMTINEPRLSTAIDSDYYNLIALFGMTLNGVGTKEEHSKEFIMYKLLSKAMNSDLSAKIISEYIHKELEFELYEILYIMGMLINQKTNRFPYINFNEKEEKELHKDLYRLLTGLSTLEENECLSNALISERELNYFEKNRFLRLINKRK